MGKKKTIADMNSAWYKEHSKTDGIATTDFCRAAGIQLPTVSLEELAEARTNIDEIGIVLAMVQELVGGAQILSNAPNVTAVELEVLRRAQPFLQKAYEEMCKATKVMQGIDPNFNEDAMPEDEDDDGEMA